ncbi:hypothetical protein, partial, partial [Absidia glauca]
MNNNNNNKADQDVTMTDAHQSKLDRAKNNIVILQQAYDDVSEL